MSVSLMMKEISKTYAKIKKNEQQMGKVSLGIQLKQDELAFGESFKMISWNDDKQEIEFKRIPPEEFQR